MRKVCFVLGFFLLLMSCEKAIEKPKNLIAKDKMIDILYDLSLLEAIKSQNIGGGISNKSANAFIYKKYQIDSTQLSESNKYYATDVEAYKKMFETVKKRLDDEIKKTGGSATITPTPVNPDVPQVQ